MNKQKSSAGINKIKQMRESGLLPPVKNVDPIIKARSNPKSLRMAINAKCFDCSGGQRKEVTLCTCTDCPLFNLRPWQKKGE